VGVPRRRPPIDKEALLVSDGPLIVQSDKTLLLEVDHPLARDCRAAIAPFAELERSPEHVHTYRVTPLALWNARAAGHDAEQVVDALVRFSRYPVPHALLVDIADTMDRFGRLTLANNPVHGLVLTTSDRAVLEEVVRSKRVAPMLGARIDADSIVVHASERGRLKQALLKIGWPAEDLAGYVDGAAHPIDLDQSSWHLRDYQREAVEGFWAGGSGVVVLPCGAGKTLVGAAAMAEAKATTLILVTNTVAGRQWKRELIARTSLTEEEIGEYSGERKEIRPVTIATYQVITTRRKGEYRHLDLFDAQDWGLIVYDEVHLLPAPIFRLTADLQSRRRLGLTATLVREDGREDDVFSLIGPKRYDAPWRDIEAQGYIAPAECIEVRVSLDDEERMTYAVAEPEERYRIAATAQSKLPVIRRVLERHPDEPTLVIGAYLDQLEELGAALDAPVIQGSTTNKEREKLFDAFRAGEIRTLVVSKVANFSIDLPEAAVPAPGPGPAAQGRRPAGALLHGGQPRHPRQRVRRPPAALPRRAGLRVHDRRRRGPGRAGRGQRTGLGGRARRLTGPPLARQLLDRAHRHDRLCPGPRPAVGHQVEERRGVDHEPRHAAKP
jgi:DNA excision repair protein ERCC-3